MSAARRTFRVKITSSTGTACVDIEAANFFDAGCIALDRYPAAFCAEAVREVEPSEPGILRRQAS